MTHSAEILLHSMSPRDGSELATLVVTFPRIILAEFNTHRVFSRNSASSRAIPVQTQIQKVLDDPFVPEQWGSNKKGMQAAEPLAGEPASVARDAWLKARDWAVEQAKVLAFEGVHKQLVNRLLEPFMWHTVIVSSTEWKNFFRLRCHPDAQPEMQKIARMMRDALAASEPVERTKHMPYITEGEYLDGAHPDWHPHISAARCARISYLRHDSVQRNITEDVNLAGRLAKAGHWSPFEHVATAAPGRHANFTGWRQLRADLEA